VKIEENTAQPTVRKFLHFFAKKFLTTIFLKIQKKYLGEALQSNSAYGTLFLQGHRGPGPGEGGSKHRSDRVDGISAVRRYLSPRSSKLFVI
jgi:hypothetical protein